MRIDRIKLKIELMKRDISQKDFAELIGVSRMTITNVVCGKSCSNEVGHKIAKALKVDITEILED